MVIVFCSLIDLNHKNNRFIFKTPITQPQNIKNQNDLLFQKMCTQKATILL